MVSNMAAKVVMQQFLAHDRIRGKPVRFETSATAQAKADANAKANANNNNKPNAPNGNANANANAKVDFGVDDIKAALYDAFLDADRLMRSTVEQADDFSGTTSCVAVVTATHIVVANAGDSRAVASTGQTTVALSWDHKPSQQREVAYVFTEVLRALLLFVRVWSRYISIFF